MRKVLSGSQALLERVVSVRLALLESYRCVICEEKLGCDRSRASARYQRQPARNVLQSLPWRLLSLAETSVVCAGPACRGRLRCMLFCRSWVAALRSGSLFSGRPAPADVHVMVIQSTCEKYCP